MRPLAAQCAIAVLAVAALVACLPGAAAHADLVSANPPIDRTHHVGTPPRSIILTFSEHLDVTTSSISVINTTSHKQVDLGSPNIVRDPPTMTVALPSDLPPGTYVVQYSAVSADDGHPNKGTIGFAIGNFEAPPSSGSNLNALDFTSAASRAALYAGFSIAFAAAALLVWMPNFPPASARRALVLGTTLHVVGVMFLFRQAFHASGAELFSVYLGSDAGRIYLVRSILGAGAWLIAVAGDFWPTRSGPFAVTAVMLGAALGSSRLGHGSVQGPAVIGIDFVHLMSAAIWVGGLILFTLFLLRNRALPVDAVRSAGIRFGTLALVAVSLLAATGLLLAVYILGWPALTHPQDLVHSAYGASLAGKVALALVMVLLAGVNRYVLLEQPTTRGLAGLVQRLVAAVTARKVRPALADGAHLGRTVAIEAVLGAVVLVLAGFLTSVSPPLAASAAPAPMELTGSSQHFLVTLRAEPAPHQGGTSELVLDIEMVDPDTGATQPMLNNTCGRPSCVTTTLQYANLAGAEPAQAALLHSDGWYVHGQTWTSAGSANITVSISDPPIFEEDVVVTFNVPGP